MANPYSSDANIFVGAPQQQGASDTSPPPPPPAVAEEDLFAEMNVFGGEGLSSSPPPVVVQDDDPFRQRDEATMGMFQQQEENIQFYAPEGNSGEKETVEYTPPAFESDQGNAFKHQELTMTEQPASPQPPSSSQQQQDTASPPLERTAKCWTMAFYRQYFDVDTDDITGRLYEVGTFKMPKFMIADCEGGEPADMYGPVWIATTLWVALAVFGEIGEEINSSDDSTAATPSPEGNKTASPPSPSSSFSFDFYWFVIVGMSVAYIYVFCTPLLLWLILKLNSVKTDLTKLITLYGYAVAPLIPGSLLTIIPSSVVKLTVIFFSSAASLAMITFNVQKLGSGLAYNWKMGYFAAVGLSHTLMTMLLFYEILFM